MLYYLENLYLNTVCSTCFIMLLLNQSWAHKEKGRKLTANFVVSQEGKENGKLLKCRGRDDNSSLGYRFRL